MKLYGKFRAAKENINCFSSYLLKFHLGRRLGSYFQNIDAISRREKFETVFFKPSKNVNGLLFYDRLSFSRKVNMFRKTGSKGKYGLSSYRVFKCENVANSDYFRQNSLGISKRIDSFRHIDCPEEKVPVFFSFFS